jgi:hypothetical protein
MAGRRGALACLLVALAVLAGGAANAQAAERQCVGLIGPETIEGNVVVPAGAVCDLLGTRVLGNVFVREEASLLANGADVRGNVEGDLEAFVDLVESAVGGTLALRESVGTLVAGSSIDGNIESTGSRLVLLFVASIGGNVKVDGGGALIVGDGLEVNGTLEAVAPALFDLHESTVNGNFYLRGALDGGFFCGNTLNGNAEFTENRVLLTIGSLASSCDGNAVKGNVKVEKNQAESEISDNDIGGNLACFGNVPPPVGGGNRVRGNREGQCAGF